MAQANEIAPNPLLTAIDNHNLSEGTSWFGKVGQAVTLGPIAAATEAGVQIYNSTAVPLANMIGGQGTLEQARTANILRGIDDNLGNYVEQNQQGINIAGFIAGSLVPGTLAVKGVRGLQAMRAAEGGVLGTNLSAATGLLRGTQAKYFDEAVQLIRSQDAPIKLLEATRLKALASGAGQQFLEAGAFELGVLATMSQSPILSEMTAGQLAQNFTVGLLLGGTVGTVFDAVKVSGSLRQVSRQVDQENAPYKAIIGVPEGAAPPQFIAAGLLINKLRSPTEGTERQMALLAQRNSTIDLKLKGALRDLSGGDEDIAQELFNRVTGSVQNEQDVISFFGNLVGASRVSDTYVDDIAAVNFARTDLTRQDVADVILGRLAPEDLFKAKKDFPEGELAPSSAGFELIGPPQMLKIASWGRFDAGQPADTVFRSAKEAFDAGADVFFNQNRTLSINPNSTLIKRYDAKTAQRTPALLTNLENGKVYQTAIPSLADLSTKASPLTLVGDLVSVAGRQLFNKVSDTANWSPAANTTSLEAAQARTIWAIADQRINADSIIGQYDFPLLEQLARNPIPGVRIRMDGVGPIAAPTDTALLEFIEQQKSKLADEMLTRGVDEREIALRLNTSVDWVTNQGRDGLVKWEPETPPAGMRESDQKYWKPSWMKPSHVALQYDTTALSKENAAALAKGELDIHSINAQLLEARKNVFAQYAGDFNERFIEAPNAMIAPDRLGAGSGLLSFGQYQVGSVGEFVSYVGQQVQQLIEKRLENVGVALNSKAQPFLYDPDNKLGAQLGSFMEVARRNSESYVLDPFGGNKVLTVGQAKKDLASAARKDFDYTPENPNLPTSIDLDPKVMAFLREHAKMNKQRQTQFNNIRALSGDVREQGELTTVYIPPIDPTKYKHFAWVVPKDNFNLDRSVIVAPDERTLRDMAAKVDGQFNVFYAEDIKRRKQFFGDFEYEQSMSDGFVDSTLKRQGLFSRYAPVTDGRTLMEEFVGWHNKQEVYLAREMVDARYADLTTSLRSFADQFKTVQTSQLRNVGRSLEAQLENPYIDYLKVMFNISRRAEYTNLNTFNGLAQTAIEKPFNALREAFKTSNLSDPKQVEMLNSLAKSNGLGTPYKDAAMAMLANRKDTPPWLPGVISRVQGILSGTVLGLDFIQAVNTIVSAPIMYSSELRTLIKEVSKSPASRATLQQMTSLNVPGQVADAATGAPLQVPSILKLVAEAHKNYHADARGTLPGLGKGDLLERYRRIGAIPEPMALQQERAMVDGLTLNMGATNYTEQLKRLEGAESIARQMVDKVERGIALGRRATGNDFAENYTRFIAADIARQVGELGQAAGTISARDLEPLILNFVNRVNGTFQASQRPMIFQGVVGQTVALWQTYTFNMMQRLFTNVGEGNAKSAAMLIGLQGSIYGMQGLPGFNYVNTHIVGTAAGNSGHKDLYTATYGSLGKDTGDWLMYGLGSNALGLFNSSLKFNLYTRGDINPRQWTILPNPANPEQLPIVSITSKFLGGLWGSVKDLQNGSDLWSSFTRGIEHASINRPLAGLAQVAQGFTTTSKGSLLVANDLWSAASLIRIAGAKPFDESVALDALYRMNVYVAADQQKLANLGSAVKSSLRQGATPDPDQMETFLTRYSASGGRIENFNRFMVQQMKNANTSQVNILRDQLHKPIAQNLMQIMGGERLQDFTAPVQNTASQGAQ